ncbi:hypothetical protein V8G54_021067 [Vigna mungo]|uniref:Uncharacterized protein n=1 Tax=Vigna mungo TaxID=3915 RepID=A0AAQ3NDN9_VIGMU
MRPTMCQTARPRDQNYFNVGVLIHILDLLYFVVKIMTPKTLQSGKVNLILHLVINSLAHRGRPQLCLVHGLIILHIGVAVSPTNMPSTKYLQSVDYNGKVVT